MFEFDLLENEEINLTLDNILLTYNNKNIKYSLIVTNMRILFFDTLNDSTDNLNMSQATGAIPRKYLKLEFNLSDIKNVVFDNDKDKYTLTSNDSFYLYDEDVKIAIENQLKS